MYYLRRETRVSLLCYIWICHALLSFHVFTRPSEWWLIMRFIFNCQNPTATIWGSLKFIELRNIEKKCSLIVQSQCFSSEFHMIKSNSQISAKSKLYSLHPFLDNDGLLRVGARLVSLIYRLILNIKSFCHLNTISLKF